MRYYLVGEDGEELIYNIIEANIPADKNTRIYQASIIRQHKVVEEYKIYIKKIAGKYFVGKDNHSWKRIAKQQSISHLLNQGKIFKVFRGYRPSGQIGSEEGAFYTKMPGKVVKILVQENQKIVKGQTVMILEAMKMENEIKASAEGIVQKIHVSVNQVVDQNILLLELKK